MKLIQVTVRGDNKAYLNTDHIMTLRPNMYHGKPMQGSCIELVGLDYSWEVKETVAEILDKLGNQTGGV